MAAMVALLLCCGIALSAAAQAPIKELNDGNKMPTLALGTGRGTAKESETVDVVRNAVFSAIKSGYRHIDTAAVYNTESEVGEGIAKAIEQGLVKREDMFITTKLWNDKHRKDQVVPALRESLKQLGLDYVDLYLIHFPVATEGNNPLDIDYLETWQGMEEAKELGLTKSIGVSNFNQTQIDRLIANSKVRPAVNEIEVNPTMTQVPLVSHCQELGIAIMAYSPFGFLVNRKSADAPPPRVDDPTLVKMADKYGKSTSQIVLRYLPHIELLSSRIRKLIYIFKNLRHVGDPSILKMVYLALCQSLLTYCITTWGGAPASIILPLERAQRAVLKIERGLVPIPKSTNDYRIAQNIDLFNFKLTDDEVATISQFNKNKRVISIPSWQDFPNYPFERQ